MPREKGYEFEIVVTIRTWAYAEHLEDAQEKACWQIGKMLENDFGANAVRDIEVKECVNVDANGGDE